jgi:hypothetical protein
MGLPVADRVGLVGSWSRPDLASDSMRDCDSVVRKALPDSTKLIAGFGARNGFNSVLRSRLLV